jgi:uncharacterized phage-associated protein
VESQVNDQQQVAAMKQRKQRRVFGLTVTTGRGRIGKISGSLCANLICMSLSIAHRKAAQALNYFARQDGGSINKLKALKLLFFADRYHLRKFGRTVSECAYFAMQHGPVPSEAKSIAEEAANLPPSALAYARKYVRKKGDYECAAGAEVDASVLSASDREALDFAWRYFGRFSGYKLRDITHHYPEWKRHERKLETTKRVPMDAADFFKEPEAGYIPCHSLTDEEREAALELFRQRQSFDKHWS